MRLAIKIIAIIIATSLTVKLAGYLVREKVHDLINTKYNNYQTSKQRTPHSEENFNSSYIAEQPTLSKTQDTNTGNFITIKLPKSVSVKLPKDWTILSDKNRQLVDTSSQAQAINAGLDFASSSYPFAANYYNENNEAIAMFNIRYYPDIKITQQEIAAASLSDIEEFDRGLHSSFAKVTPITIWMGTQRQAVNGIQALVTDYSRIGRKTGQGNFRVRLFRVMNGADSFTITVSYAEKLEGILKPISETIINSVKLGQ